MDVSAPLFGLTNGPASARDGRGRVDTAARGFEGAFLSVLLKEMRSTLEPGTMFGDGKSDVLGGLFDQFMSDHLSQADALGIAAMVRKQLAPKGTHDDPPAPAVARPGPAVP